LFLIFFPGLNEGSWTNQRFGLLSSSGLAQVVMAWACWMSGNTAVPLPANTSPDKLAFLLKDSGATVVLATKEYVSDKKSFANFKCLESPNIWQ
jgi:acyl-CoA synthetase (AMP-forming)/AMP-acid ligase II